MSMATYEALRAIDRQIAELQGWTTYQHDCNERVGQWDFIKPNGTPAHYCVQSEEYLWTAYTPWFHHDVQMALTLRISGWRLTLVEAYSLWIADYYGCPFPGAKHNRHIGATDDEPAMAICKAYIETMEFIAARQQTS